MVPDSCMVMKVMHAWYLSMVVCIVMVHDGIGFYNAWKWCGCGGCGVDDGVSGSGSGCSGYTEVVVVVLFL